MTTEPNAMQEVFLLRELLAAADTSAKDAWKMFFALKNEKDALIEVLRAVREALEKIANGTYCKVYYGTTGVQMQTDYEGIRNTAQQAIALFEPYLGEQK